MGARAGVRPGPRGKVEAVWVPGPGAPPVWDTGTGRCLARRGFRLALAT
jgi:hypothetical protein